MNPVSLLENHSACRTNRAGQSVLPNGQVWKPHLLLISFASKILAEANALLKLQDSPPGRKFGDFCEGERECVKERLRETKEKGNEQGGLEFGFRLQRTWGKLMAGKGAKSVSKAFGDYQDPWREKLPKYKDELSKGASGYWEFGAWKPLGISSRRRA